MYLPPSIKEAIERKLSVNIQKVTPVSGGDINIAGLLHTEQGNLFVKLNDAADSSLMLETEATGLNLLAASQSIPVASPLAIGESAGFTWLVLNFIESGQPSQKFWENFGASLARLHRQSNSYFGLDHHNFIGSLPQYNTPDNDWVSFFFNHRLKPQIDLATSSGLLSSTDESNFLALHNKLNEILPEEPPALTHGDLWGGNFICSSSEQGVLIDPAVSYAHREMDLAMSALFGGFAPTFYHAYQEEYPTAPGLENRIGIYQLYYLLVHVNLFGGGYVNQTRAVLSRFL